jgi:hypothetical protein
VLWDQIHLEDLVPYFFLLEGAQQYLQRIHELPHQLLFLQYLVFLMQIELEYELNLIKHLFLSLKASQLMKLIQALQLLRLIVYTLFIIIIKY